MNAAERFYRYLEGQPRTVALTVALSQQQSRSGVDQFDPQGARACSLQGIQA